MPVNKTEQVLTTKYHSGSLNIVASFDKGNDRITVKDDQGIFPQISDWSAAKLADFQAILTQIQTDATAEL